MTGMRPGDALLARLERRALLFCLVTAAGSLAIPAGGWRFALGVLAGGLLIWLSYRTIRGSIDAIVDLAVGPVAPAGDQPGGNAAASRRSVGLHLARFVGRYALLGFLAYVSMSRLRLHPVGLIVGVTSAVAAVVVEAASTLAGASRPGAR